ncbi:cell division cycle 2-like 6 (CDK8-like) (predicted), isoform CRA_a [Rattus norvegicus]|uniref:Cell division cycle 2-like 6 (CDK8-like) (Predicted), isoform CRA_a n=1 Tax=Rattus norvegicus TaxID=10116 RepID=A6KIJ2_RAT|nr:cell division cycle 2-like 6 (CDK8-like) (predicted), isoform CRA_a [Rattus norvegicus]
MSACREIAWLRKRGRGEEPAVFFRSRRNHGIVDSCK